MSASGERTFALVRLGANTLAISSEHVVEATTQLMSLKTWSQTDRGAEQVFSLRGTVIPLADLDFLKETKATEVSDAQAQCVVVLRNGPHCLGLKIDELIGLKRVEEHALVRLRHDAASDALFSSVMQIESPTSDSPELISVLDVPAFFQRSGSWSETGLGSGEAANLESQGPSRTHYALMEVRGQQVLVDSRYIMSTQRLRLLQRTGTTASEAVGVANFRGSNIQISQLVALAGTQDFNGEPLVCVVHSEGLWSGIVIDAVRQILWLDAVQIQPLFSSGLKPEDGFSGLVYDQSGLPMLVLDCDHLLARSARFPAAQGKTAQGNDPLQNGHAESESAEAYVAFHAGGHRAMRLSTIQSIINYPRNIYLAAQRHPAFVGSFHWREKGVALWDLSALLGGKPTTVDDETRVLIVAKDEHLVGLICERLLMLLPSRQIEVLKMRSETGRVIEVISHHEGGGVRKSYGKFEPTLCEELL